MDSRETKRTVPVPSVGADGEQPISQTPTASITEETTENNPPEKNYAELVTVHGSADSVLFDSRKMGIPKTP